jgi:hypothetical protein
MKKAILVLGIVSMFLMTSVAALPTMRTVEEKEQAMNKTQEVNSLNNPPNIPCKPQTNLGETSGYPKHSSYTYQSKTTDPDGDKWKLIYDFGDGTHYRESPWAENGAWSGIQRSYATSGVFYVRCYARDEHGAASDWSESFGITMLDFNDLIVSSVSTEPPKFGPGATIQLCAEIENFGTESTHEPATVTFYYKKRYYSEPYTKIEGETPTVDILDGEESQVVSIQFKWFNDEMDYMIKAEVSSPSEELYTSNNEGVNYFHAPVVKNVNKQPINSLIRFLDKFPLFMHQLYRPIFRLFNLF